MDFAHYWQYTDAVSKTLFFVLILLSLASWIVGIMRLLKSKQMANSIADDLTGRLKSADQDYNGLEFSQRKTVVEQLLLKNIANYRFELEKGTPVLGTLLPLPRLLGCLVRCGGFFTPYIPLAKVDRRAWLKWQGLWAKHLS